MICKINLIVSVSLVILIILIDTNEAGLIKNVAKCFSGSSSFQLDHEYDNEQQGVSNPLVTERNICLEKLSILCGNNKKVSECFEYIFYNQLQVDGNRMNDDYSRSYYDAFIKNYREMENGMSLTTSVTLPNAFCQEQPVKNTADCIQKLRIFHQGMGVSPVFHYTFTDLKIPDGPIMSKDVRHYEITLNYVHLYCKRIFTEVIGTLDFHKHIVSEQIEFCNSAAAVILAQRQI